MNKPYKYGLFLVLIISVIVFVVTYLFKFLGSSIIILLISAFISALIISIIIIFSAPILKDILATFRTMMRLESLSHPLLIELSLEAPGTYNHSLTVANLASRASKAIGADSILTRIGGYYHDIGKLKKPEYFIENQIPGENPHAEMDDPQKSAEIILDHVKDGVKMAEDNHFPKEIIDLIEQHHGTTIVTFFYQKAKDKYFKASREEFKYPGPKPLTPEAAILMLSDAIEAKIRLVAKITPLVIRETVDEVINTRIKEKQLEVSGLDDNKIARIRISFIETLSTIFHQRINYPGTKK